MLVKFIQDEDITNYKKCSMFIGLPFCSFKCEKDCGIKCCQNSTLAKMPNIEISILNIINRYKKNKFTSAIVFGGLEPLDSINEILLFIKEFREIYEDDIVIYTGYKESEAQDSVEQLKQFKNIIIKFGRFVPGKEPHFEKLLGINLMNPEQYAKKIS